jgi:hypothetical protein
MPKVKKKDADQKRKLLKWFKSKEGQESLKKVQDEAMVDPYGRPINVMLPEAEVSTLGNKDRDLSRDVLLGLREAAGMAPILGEGLDAAELSNIVKTGKDFYGDEADPKMYAGMTTAGLLVPNIIEKPVKGGLKLLKKAGQKLGNKMRSVKKGPKVKKDDIPESLQKYLLNPESVFENTDKTTKLPLPDDSQVANYASEGADFVRSFYSDPQVQRHLRKTAGVPKTPSAETTRAARLMSMEDEARYSAASTTHGSGKTAQRKEVERVAEEDYGGDYAKMFKERPDMVDLQNQHLGSYNKTDEAFQEKYQDLLSKNPNFNEQELLEAVSKDDEGAAALEAMFMRGQRVPDAVIDDSAFKFDLFRQPDAMGMYNPQSQKISVPQRYSSDQSVVTHEGTHFADSKFIGSNSESAKKIRKGLSGAVNPEYVDHVVSAKTSTPGSDSQQFKMYLANPQELTARARELQRSLSEALLYNPQNNPAFDGLSQKDRVSILLGDFSKLSDRDLVSLFEQASGTFRADMKVLLNEVVGGGQMILPLSPGQSPILKISKEKKERLSQLFKFSAATTGATAAYGAMDSDQQPPQGMAMGGKFKVKKKAQEGMRVKKKEGDPKKESTGYARLDARLARMSEEAPSDTTNYMRDSAERIQRQMQAESGGERDPDRAVSEAGAMGRWQIMPDTQRDLEDRGLIPRGLDPYDSKASRQMRDAKINALMKLQFIDNPPQPIPEVNKLARIYASYNYGEGNVLKALNKAKEEGVDIYGDPRAWMGYLPEETRGYLNKILFD